ncbi:conserved hypothetical protein [Mycolicibacter sinensis]|uniref:DUF2637 domain-containing protein n=1 Tax=Mycolicibacter sinensis (strain JDM601) TaxID=875328 RepID=F5YX85_MYCSD|nr:DUF2637 domain-containing protein [Mycolicibacter sinensis]AEF35354.1 conserved hypothetical protein [Mycolicibacter sinensis]
MTTNLSQAEVAQRNHRRAVRFFWFMLGGATMVSLVGNIAHAVLPYLPPIAIQIGAAAVPPVVLLAAVHGVALAVRAGASGAVYRWAVAAVAAIGIGAFALSFIALRDLMQTIGYSPAIAWIFPAIVDTAVAVATLMLVALGDKPARRTRTTTAPTGTRSAGAPTAAQAPVQDAKVQAKPGSPGTTRMQPAPMQPGTAQSVQAMLEGDVDPADADLAAELIAAGTTTQPVEIVIAVLAASRGGMSINAAAKASGINFRTAQRIVEGAARYQPQLAAAS